MAERDKEKSARCQNYIMAKIDSKLSTEKKILEPEELIRETIRRIKKLQSQTSMEPSCLKASAVATFEKFSADIASTSTAPAFELETFTSACSIACSADNSSTYSSMPTTPSTPSTVRLISPEEPEESITRQYTSSGSPKSPPSSSQFNPLTLTIPTDDVVPVPTALMNIPELGIACKGASAVEGAESSRNRKKGAGFMTNDTELENYLSSLIEFEMEEINIAAFLAGIKLPESVNEIISIPCQIDEARFLEVSGEIRSPEQVKKIGTSAKTSVFDKRNVEDNKPTSQGVREQWIVDPECGEAGGNSQSQARYKYKKITGCRDASESASKSCESLAAAVLPDGSTKVSKTLEDELSLGAHIQKAAHSVGCTETVQTKDTAGIGRVSPTGSVAAAALECLERPSRKFGRGQRIYEPVHSTKAKPQLQFTRRISEETEHDYSASLAASSGAAAKPQVFGNTPKWVEENSKLFLPNYSAAVAQPQDPRRAAKFYKPDCSLSLPAYSEVADNREDGSRCGGKVVENKYSRAPPSPATLPLPAFQFEDFTPASQLVLTPLPPYTSQAEQCVVCEKFEAVSLRKDEVHLEWLRCKFYLGVLMHEICSWDVHSNQPKSPLWKGVEDRRAKFDMIVATCLAEVDLANLATQIREKLEAFKWLLLDHTPVEHTYIYEKCRKYLGEVQHTFCNLIAKRNQLVEELHTTKLEGWRHNPCPSYTNSMMWIYKCTKEITKDLREFEINLENMHLGRLIWSNDEK